MRHPVELLEPFCTQDNAFYSGHHRLFNRVLTMDVHALADNGYDCWRQQHAFSHVGCGRSENRAMFSPIYDELAAARAGAGSEHLKITQPVLSAVTVTFALP
eukprot:6202130-Pleurochrysis_carterae.AAC.5